MKKMIFGVAACCFYLAVNAQQIPAAQPSPTQTLKQNFGLSFVELSYSRPGLKGRTVGVELAPFGSVWRTGANNATTLTFGDDVVIGDKQVPAGKYGLLTIPGKDEWTVIITKQLDVTSPQAYKQENDVVRVTAKPVKLSEAVETFTIQFANLKPESCDVQMLWGNTAVTLPLKTETDKKIMGQIDNLLNKDTRPFYAGGLYYLENGKDLNKAVTWFDKAIEQNPKSVTAYHQKAKALAKLGKKEDARKAATRSLELAKESKNNNYIGLNETFLKGL